MKKLMISLLVVSIIFTFSSCKEESSVIHCYNCGKKISKGVSFCGYCGTDLNHIPDDDSSESINESIDKDNLESVPNVSKPNQNTQQRTFSYKIDSNNKRTCFYVGCNNAVSGISQYCSEHTCAKSGCTSQKSYNADYCLLHKCLSAGCNNPKIDSGSYCSEHTCVENGCTSQKAYDSDYCYLHK